MPVLLQSISTTRYGLRIRVADTTLYNLRILKKLGKVYNTISTGANFNRTITIWTKSYAIFGPVQKQPGAYSKGFTKTQRLVSKDGRVYDMKPT